jgi:hypothetical protein
MTNDEGQMTKEAPMTNVERVAFEVELHDMTTIVFATTKAKARWQAVKAYWEAYGRTRNWPRPVAWRSPRYDSSYLRHEPPRAWSRDWVEGTLI